MKWQLVDKPGKYNIKVKVGEELGVVVIGKNGETNIIVELMGKGARACVLGVIVGKRKDKIILDTKTVHKVANTHAETEVYGVMRGKAIAEVSGIIKIEKKAQRVTDFLTEKILLLSDEAQVVVEPALEIEADEVRASHAATVAPIDKKQTFYLTSRGLSEIEAEKMIVRGFLETVMKKIKDDKIRKLVGEEIYA